MTTQSTSIAAPGARVANRVVQYVGDYFDLRVPVEVDLDLCDPDITSDGIDETAQALATNMMRHHYGIDIEPLATIDIEVLSD